MGDSEIKVLVFTLNSEYFAADIIEIEKILGYEKTTKIPDSPEFVEGVINYQDSILPIVNLSTKFGIKNTGTGKDTKIIVTREEQSKIGIIVDSVNEVRDIKLSNVENPPEIVSGISKRYLKGLIREDKKIIIFLNLAAILTEEEKKQLGNENGTEG